MRGRAADLARELTALGMGAAVTGRSVRAWMPGQEDCVLAVTPVWLTERDGFRWRRKWWRGYSRCWWWQHGERGSCGYRRRADARGAAVGVAALLLRLSGEPGGSL